MELHGILIRRVTMNDGKIVEFAPAHNTIVNVGRYHVADLIGKKSSRGFTHLAMGTNRTGATPANSALVSELTTGGLSRAAATITRTLTTVQFVKTFTLTTAKSIMEYGIFNSQTVAVGTMMSRITQVTLTLANANKIQLDWSIGVRRV